MQIDFSSQAWLCLQEYLQTELERLRQSNDSVEMTELSRGALTGEIRLCKRLLALPTVADRDEAIRRADPYLVDQ